MLPDNSTLSAKICQWPSKFCLFLIIPTIAQQQFNMCVSCGCVSENQVVNGVRVSSCRTISLRPRHSHRGGCGVESTRPARAPKKLPPKIIHRVITIQKN